ncbi:lambda exonuclease family protein [Sphingomicrobium sp. XHP0235]|uniref:lambda exonuclease family protein n=1 Tax=Sphingomicrobium aquimarinum TaxID=3133971 RepID=UPI0031FF2D17
MHSFDQGSAEWFACRLGKVTASKLSDVMATVKSGEAAGRRNYRAQLVAERLSGQAADTFTNAAMQWGTDTEAAAREAYERETLTPVVEVGFADHPTIPNSGASPDGLVGDDGLVEIKCPNTATHIDTLGGKPIDRKYLLQIQWQMACTGRAWCDFVSFDPRMPETMALSIQRVERDDTLIAEMEEAVTAFLGEVDTTVTELRNRYEQKEAA